MWFKFISVSCVTLLHCYVVTCVNILLFVLLSKCGPDWQTTFKKLKMLSRLQRLICELHRLNVDIVALQETRLPDSGSLKEEHYTIFWQGESAGESREHGIGFVIRNILLKMIEPPNRRHRENLQVVSTSSVATLQRFRLQQKQRTSFKRHSTQPLPSFHCQNMSTFCMTSMQGWAQIERHGLASWVTRNSAASET